MPVFAPFRLSSNVEYLFLSILILNRFICISHVIAYLILSYLVYKLKGSITGQKRGWGGGVTKICKHRLDPCIFNVYICLSPPQM